jgi:hypothetical protein
LPAGALLAACFGTSTTPLPPGFDGGLVLDSGTTSIFDASTGDSSTVGEAGIDGGGDAADAGGGDAADAGDVDAGDAGEADAGDVQAIFTTGPVDFGLVNCGSAPTATKTYSFQNIGPLPVTYSATVGAGSVFAIVGSASGTLQGGQSGTLTVSAGTVPASSTAGTPLTGTLTLTTNVPGATTVVVPLQITPQGGSLTTSPAVVGFGQIELEVAAAPLPVTVTNVGNAPVGVTLGAPTDPEFSVTYTGAPAAAILAAGAVLPGAEAAFTPTSAGQKTATVPLTTTGVLCASPASAIALTGEGSSEPVTVGPSPLDFTTVACGSVGAAKKVTITNGYTFAVTYTATLAAGAASPYTLDVPTGSVPAKGTATVTVTPKPLPVPASVAANAYGDTLTIATNAPGGTPATVPLKESASGAVLTLAMAQTAFGDVAANAPVSRPFTVTNTGNVAAALTLSVTGAGFSGAFTGVATAAAGGGTAGGNVTFSPASSSTAAAAGRVSVTSSGVVCAAAAPLAVTAQPEVAVATFSAATIGFSTICGGNASGTVNVPITNGGDTSLAISSVSIASGHVNLVSFPATIAAGATGNIVLLAVTPATAGGIAAGTYADKLSFTTNERGTPTHTIPLSVVIHGANLAFTGVTGGNVLNFTPSACPQVGVYPVISYGVTNTGDMAATVQGPTNYDPTMFTGETNTTARFVGLNAAGAPDGTFFDGPVSIGPGVAVTDSIREYDQYDTTAQFAPCTGTDSFTYELAGGPICVALPALVYNFNYTPQPEQSNCECS